MKVLVHKICERPVTRRTEGNLFCLRCGIDVEVEDTFLKEVLEEKAEEKDTEEEDLLVSACPFCLGVKLGIEGMRGTPVSATTGYARRVRCHEEGCDARGPIRPTPKEAIDAWNFRPDIKLRRKEEPPADVGSSPSTTVAAKTD